MDDAYFQELDQQDIERIEEENDAPVGPDEAEEEAVVTTRDVKPKRIITKPRLKLDDKRLKGPRGLSVLEPMFKKVVLRGPGYERRDLDMVMSLLEHWAHRLFPKMTFDDCLEKIEELGHKKSVSSYMALLRTDCADPPDERLNDDEVAPIRSRSPSPQPTVDPFDLLLDRPVQSELTQEQRERMERNKLIALERRRAKLKAKYERTDTTRSPAQQNDTNNETSEHSGIIDSITETNAQNENRIGFAGDDVSDNTTRIPMETDTISNSAAQNNFSDDLTEHRIEQNGELEIANNDETNENYAVDKE